MKNLKSNVLLVIVFLIYNTTLSQTTLTLLNTYPIGASVSEPSGLAFDKVKNQLFMVSDSDNIYRLSITGVLQDTYNYSGDLEGVSMYNEPNVLLVAIEDTHQIMEYNYVTNASTLHSMNYTNIGSSGSGIEGVTYNPTTGEIYFLNEKSPGALIVANSSFNVTNEYPLNYAGDYSASYYVEETGLLWLGSDKESTIYKCNTDGSVIETFPMTINGNSAGNDLEKLEGIAIDHANQLLYVVTDAGQNLYVYQINDPTLSVDDSTLESKIAIFPVPVKEALHIKIKATERLRDVKFYNSLGQLVKEEKINTALINVNDLESGIYFLEASTTKNNLYRKTIIIE